MKAHFLTDRGLVRDQNEDSGGVFYNTSDQFLAVIADGMGGHLAGDVASRMAVEWIQENWEKTSEFTSITKVEKWIHKNLQKANQKIFKQANSHEEYQGMGTTIVLAIGIQKRVVIAHIGDSRCYLQENKNIKQVTEDHSLVNELIRSGQLSEEDAAHYPRKNVVLKALGTEKNIEPDIQAIDWKEGDQLLLCSDGLSDKVLPEELEDYLNDDESLHEIAKSLVDLANERGGEDNISLIIVQNEDNQKKHQGGDDGC